MKIIWLSNVEFQNNKIKATGSWLQPLAEMLVKSGKCDIINITFGDVTDIVSNKVNGIIQYLIPKRKASHFGQVANWETCKDVANIEDSEHPDIIHIWGTENVWVSIYQKGFLKCKKTFVDIQGLLYAYYPHYLGGLTPLEIWSCTGIKEFLMPKRNLLFKQYHFKKKGEVETECLKAFKYISTQSEWVRSLMRAINPKAKLFSTKIILRKEFYECEKWHYHFKKTSSPIIFSSCSAAISYKGIHQLIKMTAVLKEIYPQITCRIAGAIRLGNRLNDGYYSYLINLIKKYKLEDNIIFIGSLSSDEIIKELQNADVCVVPSFVETYCLALAEALMVGIPCVVSYAGALPETAVPNEEALFYNSIDYVEGADLVHKLLENENVCEQLSLTAMKRRKIENDPQVVLETQLNIYKELLDSDD